MKTIAWLLTLLMVVNPLAPFLETEPAAPLSGAEIATVFYENLITEKFGAALTMLGEEVLAVIPSEETMQMIWQQLLSQVGAYLKHEDVVIGQLSTGMDAYIFPTEFAQGRCSMQLTVSEADGKVTGWLIVAGLGEAEDYLGKLFKGDFAEAFAVSSQELQSYFQSAEGLETSWQTILADCGTLQSQQIWYSTLQNESAVHVFKAVFTEGEFFLQVVIEGAKISGIRIYPVASNQDNQNALAKQNGPQPSSDLPQGVAEQDIVINKGEEMELYGKLCYPDNVEGPLPVAVLVHGSGAHDMDETAYGYAPFKDLAYGLAQRGIAVLRYHKVTYAYPENFSNEITIDQETVDDAVAARLALLEQAEIELGNIYVVGHSLGGMMAPRIASRGDYDGMVLLAGSPRSLVDIVYDQALYLLPLTMSDSEQLAAYLDQYAQLYAQSLELREKGLKAEELAGRTLMGLPAIYVHSMDILPPAQYIEELDLPMLILQGSKDFQVYPDKDFALYEDITEGLQDVTMKEYPGLNHFFAPSSMEKPDLSEYLEEGHVSEEVIDDIASWLLERDD